MAKSAERDVYLRLKIVPDRGNEAAVNKAVQIIEKAEERATKARTKSADAAQKAADRTAAAAAKASEKTAAAAEKARAKEAAASEKAARSAAKERERQAREAERTYDREAQAALRAYSRITRAQEQQRDRLESLTDQENSYGVAAKRAGLDAAEGAITAARGFAELGLLSEESTDKLLRKLIGVKAGFDVLQGGFKVWQGMIEWINATAKATEAAAAAQEILNAAQAKGAVTGAAKAGGAAAGAATAAAAGAAGTAAGSAAGTAAATGGASAALVAFKGLGVVLGKVAVAATAALAINELVAYLARVAGFDWESPTMAFLSWSKSTEDLAASEERLSKAEAARSKRQEEMAKKAEDQRAFDALVRSAAGMQQQISDLSNTLDEGTAAGNARKRAEAEVAAGREISLRQSERGALDATKAAGGVASRTGVETANDRVVAAQQKIVDIQRQQVQLSQENIRVKQDAIRTAEQEVETAKRAVAEEKARYQTTLARFGALKETEQAELKVIAAQVKAGKTISVEQAKFLQSTGIGGATAEKALASAGGAAGGADVLSALGENTGVNSAVGNLAAAEGELTKRQAELATETEHLNDAVKTLQQDAVKLGEAFNEAIRFLQEPLTDSNGRFGNGQGPIQISVPQPPPAGSAPAGGGQVADAAGSLQRQQDETQRAALAAFDAMLQQQRKYQAEWESRRAQAAAVGSSIS